MNGWNDDGLVGHSWTQSSQSYCKKLENKVIQWIKANKHCCDIAGLTGLHCDLKKACSLCNGRHLEPCLRLTNDPQRSHLESANSQLRQLHNLIFQLQTIRWTEQYTKLRESQLDICTSSTLLFIQCPLTVMTVSHIVFSSLVFIHWCTNGPTLK